MKVVESESFICWWMPPVPEISNPFRSLKHFFSENGETLQENALLVNREETYLRNETDALLPLDAIGFDSEEAYRAASGDTE